MKTLHSDEYLTTARRGNNGSRSGCRQFLLFLLPLVLFFTNGCVRDHGRYSTYAPGLKLAPDTRAIVQPLPHEAANASPTDKNGFNPDDEMAAVLDKELEKAGLKGQPNTPNVIVLTPIIADYEGGNAFVRTMGVAPDAGQTVLLVRCKLKRDGDDIGTINVRETWEPFSVASGVASIGQWKAVFHTVSENIVKELKLGIRSNQ